MRFPLRPGPLRTTSAHAGSLWRDLGATRRLGSEINPKSGALLTQRLRPALPRPGTGAAGTGRISAVGQLDPAEREAA